MSSNLPVPSFIDRDVNAIRTAIVARLEELLGAPLPPVSTERNLCELLAYRESLVRIAIQEACLQNLWAYARYPMIDHLAALLGERRIAATPAVAPFSVTLAAPRAQVSVIPEGFEVRSKDGRVVFALDADVSIPAGELAATTQGTATATGTGGNGYLAGQVSEIVSPLDFQVTVVNTDTTAGGTVTEDTEAMRERVPQVLSVLSGAGPSDAYEALARRASSAIIDAKASNGGDGVVRTTIRAAEGVASEALLAQVATALSGKTSVPLNDTIEVVGGTPVTYDLVLGVWLYRPQEPRTPQLALDDVKSGVLDYLQRRGRKLGYQVIGARVLDTACNVAEVYDAELQSELPTVGTSEYAELGTLTVNLLGFTEEPLP